MQDWYDGASPKNDDATKVRSVEDISPRKTFVWQHGCSNLSHKLDKAPRLSIRRVIWILASDTVFVKSTNISTNIETPMLSTSSYLSCLSHFSCLLSLSPSIGLMFWKKIWDDRGIHLYSGSLICPQPFNIGTERSEAYLRLIRKTRKSGYQPATIIWQSTKY